MSHQAEEYVTASTSGSETARQLRDLIRQRTDGRIKELHVTEKEDKVLVWGYVSSTDLKQRAIQAVQEILGNFPFQVAIEVTVDLEDEQSKLLSVPWQGLGVADSRRQGASCQTVEGIDRE
jgi:hypothetical protein